MKNLIILVIISLCSYTVTAQVSTTVSQCTTNFIKVAVIALIAAVTSLYVERKQRSICIKLILFHVRTSMYFFPKHRYCLLSIEQAIDLYQDCLVSPLRQAVALVAGTGQDLHCPSSRRMKPAIQQGLQLRLRVAATERKTKIFTAALPALPRAEMETGTDEWQSSVLSGWLKY